MPSNPQHVHLAQVAPCAREHASGSLPKYHGHPPATSGGLLSLVPDLVLGPRKALDSGELQQPGRRGSRPASSARGRGCRWTGQPWLSNRHIRASTGRAWTGDVPRVAKFQTGRGRGQGVTGGSENDLMTKFYHKPKKRFRAVGISGVLGDGDGDGRLWRRRWKLELFAHA